MEPRVKTFMEHSGFFDEELKTGEHDSILVSLMDKDRMKDVIFSVYPEVKEGLGYWASDFVVSDPETTHQVMEFPTWDIINEDLRPDEICRTFREKYPLSKITPSGVEEQLSRLHSEVSEFRSLERPIVDITALHPVVWGRHDDRSIIGYIDLFVRLTYVGTTHFSPFKNCRNCSYDFFIEVRHKIESVGEVLRQMRTYMEFTRARPVLVAPVDPKIKETIEAQGIPVYAWDL